LTLSGASLPPLQRRGLAPSNGSISSLDQIGFLTLHKTVEEIICGRRKAKREVFVPLHTMQIFM
jgi:hypothetical protein